VVNVSVCCASGRERLIMRMTASPINRMGTRWKVLAGV
jgi:hypothetical protein